MQRPLSWFPRQPEADAEPPPDEPGLFDLGDHDPIVRYAAAGIFVILATAALAIARPVALPVTAGVVFGLVLGPLTDGLARRGLPHPAAAGLVVVTGALALMAIFAVLAAPVAMGADQIPAIVDTLRAKLDGMFDMLRRLQGGPAAAPAAAAGTGVGASLSPLLNIAMTSTSAAGGLLIFIGAIYFYLSTRRQLKARVLRLCLGRDARQVAGTFFEEVESRIAAYFAVVTVINLVMGALAGLIAWAAGFPYPVFWGVLAFVLNYLPFVGPFIMSGLMLGAGLMTAESTLLALSPVSVFLVLHFFEGNLITPSLVGRRLTVSPFLVFLSFVFWLWLWGPVGAILSTPLLLIAAVMAEVLTAYRRLEQGEGEVEVVVARGTGMTAARLAVRDGEMPSAEVSIKI